MHESRQLPLEPVPDLPGQASLRRPGSVLIAFWGLLLLSFMAAAAGASQEREAVVLTPKSLQRWPDPVIVEGRLLGNMTGLPLSHLRLYAFREGRFEPIRYQIDEMTGEDGDWILTEGKIPNKELGNQTFDPWDKLVFMADDTGARVAEQGQTPKSTRAKEIEVIDPITGEKGWCYLKYFASTPPPRSSLPDYIAYEYETETLQTDYLCGQNIITENGEHSNYYKHLYIPKSAGGNEQNFVDRLKIRPTIKLFFGSVTVRLTEERVKGDTLAYKTGPIRLIRRLEQYVLLPGGIKALRAVADINQFRNIGNCPAIFEIPFRMDTLVSSFVIRFGTDYSRNAFGARVSNSNNPGGFLVDGRMSEKERRHFAPGLDNWRLITGEIGTFMNRTIPFPEVKKHVSITLSILDDATVQAPPETYPGTIGSIWQAWDLTRAPKGKYIMFLEFYWIPNYKPGDEIQYLNYLDHPLRVRVEDREGQSLSLLIANLGERYQ